MKSSRGSNTARILVSVSPELKAELEAEARDNVRSLSDYVRILLSLRWKAGKLGHVVMDSAKDGS